jgi:hypothetical protein
MADLRGLELARPGTYQLAAGPMTFTEQELEDAARYAKKTGRASPTKLGHVDPRFDGEPAMAWLSNLTYTTDDRGPVLKGDLEDMPEWLAAAAPKHWPHRSVEGWKNYTDADGEEFAFVVDGLALLGVTPPGITSIQSLRDMPAAVSASARRVIASFGEPQTPAPGPGVDAPQQEGPAGMDSAKLREALGLPADASDDEVRTGLTDAGILTTPAPTEAIPVAASGTMVVSRSNWEQMQKTIQTLTEHVEKSKRDDRDKVIASAVQDGKFTPAQKVHFAQLWDADPDGTRTLIDKLTPNTALAVMASGYAGDVEVDADYAALYGAPSGASKVG